MRYLSEMPYEFKADAKLTSAEVLAYVRDETALGNCVTVFHVAEFSTSRDIPYEGEKHRLNDASQRLRTLEKSGYLKKVSKDYEDKATGLTSKSAQAKIAECAKSGPGRPPAMYTLTIPGSKYAETMAGLYIDEQGKPTDRDDLLSRKSEAWIFLLDDLSRIIALGGTREGAIAALAAWAKHQKLKMPSYRIRIMVEPKDQISPPSP